MAEPITIEAQIKELLAAGWKKNSSSVWTSPTGEWFIGPHGAWKVMRGMDATGKVRAPQPALSAAERASRKRKEVDLGA